LYYLINRQLSVLKIIEPVFGKRALI
jgi:hypothetical protein